MLRHMRIHGPLCLPTQRTAFSSRAMTTLVFAAFLAVCSLLQCGSVPVSRAATELLGGPSISSIKGQPLPFWLYNHLNLSLEEQALLKHLHITPEEVIAQRSRSKLLGSETPIREGIPDGVQCEPLMWCDSTDICSRICKKGSVEVDPWLESALKYQWRLARQQPLCYAQIPGTHNSAITLADGYGNRDLLYQQYLQYIGLVASEQLLETNNQWLSITDQLNLGIRWVELDVHWVEERLRIAHCGGFHSPTLNRLISLLNLIAKLFHHEIHWDSETVGCSPSLSSIAAADQRPFADALEEIAAWLQQPQNTDEFLVVFFDDQPDLGKWGKVEQLMMEVTGYFPPEKILTPAELREMHKSGVTPTIDDLVASGKQLLLLSGTNYGPAMDPLINSRSKLMLCNYTEPPVRYFHGPNDGCIIQWTHSHNTSHAIHLGTGVITRMPACELQYGPLDCDFEFGDNAPLLDESSLPNVTSCGVNVPSPDRLTNPRVAATIWSWAEGEPWAGSSGGAGDSAAAVATAVMRVSKIVDAKMETDYNTTGQQTHQQQQVASQHGAGRIWSSRRLAAKPGSTSNAQQQQQQGSTAAAGLSYRASGDCAMIHAVDGRWRTSPCSLSAPAACRYDKASLGAHSNQALWRLSSPVANHNNNDVECPQGYSFDVPHTARENLLLEEAMASAGAEHAWLALHAPDFLPSWAKPAGDSSMYDS